MAFRPFYRRTFLNKRGFHAGAYALADITLEEPFSGDDGDCHVSAALTLSDCSRIVTVDFDAGTVADARNALHKAHALKKLVDDFVPALEEAISEAGLDRAPRRPRE